MSRNDDNAGGGIYKVETVPPPPGTGDAYTAPTKVGPMTSALVEEMMHAAKAKADAKAEEKKRAAASAAPTARHPRFAGVPVGVVPRAALGPLIPRVDVPDPPEPAEPKRVVEEPIFTAPKAPADIAPIVAPIVVPPAAQPAVAVVAIDELPEFPLALPPMALASPPSSAPPPPPARAFTEPLPSRSAPPAPVAQRTGLSFGRVVLVAAAATLVACVLAVVTYLALTRGWHFRLRF